MKRVLSLLPSATEMVCRLGGRDGLVGISHECDHPPDVVGLPVLTRPRLGPARSSADVDRSVRGLVSRALSIYEIDVEALVALRPEVVITQDLCSVCAVSLSDVCAALKELARPDGQSEINVISLHPTRLDEIWSSVLDVAEAIGCQRRGPTLCRELLRRVDETSARAARARRRPSVVTVEWLDPVMLGGTWMPELVRLAGGEPLGVEAGAPAPTPEASALVDLPPDVVIVKPCGFPVERTLEELPVLRRRLPWSRWPAVRSGRVYVADGNAYFNRPGPRIVDSLEILAACLHPELFPEPVDRHGAAVRRIDERLRVHAWAAP